MNPIAQRLNEASVVMEGTPHPELVEMLRIAAEEIQRLQGLRDKAIESVWTGRRFYFKVLKNAPNTPLACVFNGILEALEQSLDEHKANWGRYYPAEGKTAEPAK